MNHTVYSLLVGSFLFTGCWSLRSIETDSQQVHITPKPINDSTSYHISVATTSNCDSLVRLAFIVGSNYVLEQVNSSNDQWHLIISSKEDTLCKLQNKINYLMSIHLNVIPHNDSVLISYPVEKITPLSFWQNLKIIMFWPMFLLLIGIGFIIAAFTILKVGVKAIV
jgi:hypothetical protein